MKIRRAMSVFGPFSENLYHLALGTLVEPAACHAWVAQARAHREQSFLLFGEKEVARVQHFFRGRVAGPRAACLLSYLARVALNPVPAAPSFEAVRSLLVSPQASKYTSRTVFRSFADSLEIQLRRLAPEQDLVQEF